MEYLARRLSKHLSKKGYIEEDKIEKIRFAIELCFTQIFTFTSVIIIGMLITNLKEIFLYLMVFISVKHYLGGYHAKTYLRCYGLTLLNTIMILKLSVTFQEEIVFIPFLILMIILYVCKKGSMVESETKLNKAKYTRDGIILTIFFCIMSLSFMFIDKGEYSCIICNTLIGIIMMMEVGNQIKKERRK